MNVSRIVSFSAPFLANALVGGYVGACSKRFCDLQAQASKERTTSERLRDEAISGLYKVFLQVSCLDSINGLINSLGVSKTSFFWGAGVYIVNVSLAVSCPSIATAVNMLAFQCFARSEKSE